MGDILWLALGVTAGIGVAVLAVSVAAAWRLHRRTSEKLQAERKAAGRAQRRR